MNHLFDLLTELSIDPFKQAAFVAERQYELLTEEEQAALRQPVAPEAQASIAGGAWARCAFVLDPGPDPDDDPDLPDLPDSPADAKDRLHAARAHGRRAHGLGTRARL
ncbi:hypothetical protein [Sorangium sp. So ce1024]|uniref:hypothetical protein n=1 Tax=Sorangium sp. So ce1024 TaxID=3133327 RepID=UPI003EFE6725